MRLIVKKSQLIILVMALLIFPILLRLDVDIFLAIAVELCVILLLICFKDVNTNIYFLCFLGSFFVFLVSGDLAEELFNRSYWQQFSKNAEKHSYICICISFLFLLLGYVIENKKNLKVSTIPEECDNNDIISLRQASKYLYYASYIILLLDTLNKVFYVRVNGYVSYYTGYSSILGPLAQLGDFAPITLCAFLATFPKKKECMMPLILYCIYAICGFMVGQRGALIYNLIFIFGYLFYRNRNLSDGEIWIQKKYIIAICLSAPLLIVFLQIYGYVREGMEIKFTSIGSSIIDFFVNIGASSKVIKAGYDYSGELESFKFYSLGDTLNYFRYSRLFHWFADIPATHTARYALEGHSFGDMISYTYMRTNYLAGQGAGSSYVACLYADFGYLGVAVGNFIYGILFKKISNLTRRKWLSTSIKMYFLFFLIKAPRGSYDGWIGATVNVTYIVVMVGIYLFAGWIRQLRNTKRILK